jgi:hypothetical protein
MSGFRLLAIRPLKDCDGQFLKNLRHSTFYKFYQDYDFVLNDNNESVTEILYNHKTPEDLYGNNISISAIVGKNGSGKSTLVELFSSFVFCFSLELNLIDLDDFRESHNLSKEEQNLLTNEIENFKLLACDLYFVIDNKIYGLIKDKIGFTKIIFEKEKTDKENESIYKFQENESTHLSKLSPEHERNTYFYESFFYSILANYSLYGLNTNETGIWLKSIFHKNDGYQTPIVLNPMRTEGNININRVTYLSKSRLLGNMFVDLNDGQTEENSMRCLVNKKIVDKILLSIDFRKFNVISENGLEPHQKPQYVLNLGNKSIYLEYTELNKTRNRHDSFRILVSAFYPNFDFNNSQLSNTKIKKLTKEYILKKTEDIIRKYPQFKAYKNRVFRTNAKKETIELCFSKLSDDFTHSTFKLRQALNFLIFDFYDFKNTEKKGFRLSTKSKDGIADIINREFKSQLKLNLNENQESWKLNPDSFDLDESAENIHKTYNLTNFLPPSFFEVDFEFRDRGFFKDLSSGEKQMIYSINSIVYHLINLDSISSLDIEERVCYKHFNIIFDEIELYFHPEFQRIYINELIKSLGYLNQSNYKFNIVFLTHSPFILSDVPNSNIMRLVDGKTKYSDEETYASNVHDLLANDFFLEDGFMGEHVKEKIKDLLRYLTEETGKERPNKSWSPKQVKELISIIGEPLLKYDLKELYLSKFYSEIEIDEQIKKLQELKKVKNDNN